MTTRPEPAAEPPPGGMVTPWAVTLVTLLCGSTAGFWLLGYNESARGRAGWQFFLAGLSWALLAAVMVVVLDPDTSLLGLILPCGANLLVPALVIALAFHLHGEECRGQKAGAPRAEVIRIAVMGALAFYGVCLILYIIMHPPPTRPG